MEISAYQNLPGSIRAIAEIIREPLVILNEDLQVLYVNDTFSRKFQKTETDMHTCSIYELGNGQWNIAGLRKALNTILADDAMCKDLRIDQTFPDIGRRIILLNGRRIDLEAGGKPIILLTLEDRTDTLEAGKDVRECYGEHSKLVETFKAISTDVIYRRNLNTDKYDFISQAVEKLTGISSDTFTSFSLEDFLRRIHPDDVERIREDLVEIKEKRNFSGVLEFRFLAENGEYILLGDNFTVIQNKELNLNYWVGVLREISGYKNLENQVRMSEERLRLAVEAADLGTWDLDLITGTMIRSLRHDEIWGYSELQSKWGIKIARRHVLPEDRSMIKDAFAKAIKTGKLSFEARVRWRDGSIHWIAPQGIVHFDKQGKPIRVIGVVADITRRKQTESALEQARDRFQQQVRLFQGITSTTPDFVYVFDLQGRFIYANRRLLEVWGMSLPDIIGKTPRELGYEQWHHDLHMREIAEVIETKHPIKGEVPFKAPLTGIFGVYEHIFTPVIGPDGEVESIAGTTRDVTERKHQEDERKKLIEKLEASNKELQGFTYSVSHDLRAPIRHMNIFAELLKKDAWPVLSLQSRSFLTTILKASGTMSTLADELLQFSRMGRIELNQTLVNLNTVIHDVILNHAVDIKDRNVQWRIADLPQVWGDAAMIQLVFLNLIGNALKFTRSRPIAVIEIGFMVEETEYVMYIKDNGIGFDMQYYDKLFGIFQRLHGVEDIEGSGIGLANVARIVKRHGGRVWAEGKLNEGAVFYLAFPKEKVELNV